MSKRSLVQILQWAYDDLFAVFLDNRAVYLHCLCPLIHQHILGIIFAMDSDCVMVWCAILAEEGFIDWFGCIWPQKLGLITLAYLNLMAWKEFNTYLNMISSCLTFTLY